MRADLLASLDAKAEASGVDRTALIEIAVRAMLKRGVPATLEVAE